MGECAPPNVSSCTNFPELQSNPDISGIGVRHLVDVLLLSLGFGYESWPCFQILIGFAASAWFTLGFCVAYYLINNEDALNSVDIMFLDKWLERWRCSPRSTSKAWSEALQGAVCWNLASWQVISLVTNTSR